MVYTVTLNPSLDYTAKAMSNEIGKTNRTTDEYITPGGKGLNVSIMLSRLGIPTTAFGISAGFTGNELKRLMQKEGCSCDFTEIDGLTRINVKLLSNEVTEFNGSGITLNLEIVNEICEKISKLNPSDFLVLAGSIPNGADTDIYYKLCKSAKKDTNIIIDTNGEPLKKALNAEPFLIKPNIDELCDLFEVNIENQSDIIKYSKLLQGMGAQNVLVSLGDKGAILVTAEGKEYYCDTPAGNLQNSVGAGDSMVAGFIAEYLKSHDMGKALKLGVAAGSATAFSPWLADADMIYEILDLI